MINVQLTQRWLLSAILTLVLVTEHEVAARETNGDLRGAIIPVQMEHAWDA